MLFSKYKFCPVLFRGYLAGSVFWANHILAVCEKIFEAFLYGCIFWRKPLGHMQ